MIDRDNLFGRLEDLENEYQNICNSFAHKFKWSTKDIDSMSIYRMYKFAQDLYELLKAESEQI